MIIRTKILATLGPASRDKDSILALARAGCDTFRVNFSHGRYEDHQLTLDNIRAAEAELGEPIGVLADLCGPKIRTGIIAGGAVELVEGNEIVLQRSPIEGSASRISTTLPEIIDSVKLGERLLLDDGKLALEVVGTRPDEVVCRILRGGTLSSSKGINLPHTALKVSALTVKDRADVQWIAQRSFDWIALSFVREAADVIELRRLLREAGGSQHIVAKIEKPQALADIDAILEATDAIMVARGDLGVEMDLPSVPVAQKRLAHKAHAAGKPCIVATQMLESMTASAVPTRAEVSDVANAVLDLTDAVMLSGETAVGKFPREAVAMMDRIVSETQAYHDEIYRPTPIVPTAFPTTVALANAVHQIMAAERIAGIVIYTATGTTARMFAKSRPPCPILALSPDLATVRRMGLYYAVYARQLAIPEHTSELLAVAGDLAKSIGIAKPGDKLLVLSGRPLGAAGATNTLVVHTVG